MNDRLLFFAIMLLIAQLVFAQSKISGSAIDSQSSNPIEFANIALLRQDSTFVKGTATDADGHFTFDNVSNGDYLLSIAFIGYQKEYISINHLDKNMDLGKVQLSTSDMALNDVTVTANAIIRKVDRQVVVPTQSQVEASHNGIDLLQRLQLSRLTIDQFNNKISVSGGGDVQLRINGALVTMADIMALNPADIIRIEYHDDPGMRYNNAGAVIDYITRRKETGGSVFGDFQNGISKIGFAEDHFALKLNNRKSEFGVNTYWHYRNIDWTRENDERFIFPNKELRRLEEGIPTQFRDKQLNTALNYSLQDLDKYYLNVALRYNYQDTPNGFTDRNSTLSSSDNDIPLGIKDHSTWNSKSPSLDVYFQKNLKNDQLLIFEVVGTYIDSRSTRLYQESRKGNVLTDIFSDIVGDKYSLIAEGIYEKRMKESKLSTGIRHSQSYTENAYAGNIVAATGMNLAETYVYAEYQIKKSKMNYTLGLGAMRTYYTQADNTQETYFLRPTLRLTYTMNDNAFIRYNGYVSGYAPSLGDLGDVMQIIDSLQIRRGNPLLESVWYTNHMITLGYKKGIFDTELYARYNYDHKPVMETTLFEDNKFVRTIENHKAFHRLNSEWMFRIKPLKDYLSINLTPGFNHYVSLGNNYKHTYSNLYFRASLDANYKHWILSAMMFTRRNWFWGETMNQGENIHFISFGYNKPRWTLMLGTINLFTKVYSTESRNYSALAPNVSRVATGKIAPMFFVNFSFNLNFGRQYKGGDKRLNNSDSDAGMMSGAKK